MKKIKLIIIFVVFMSFGIVNVEALSESEYNDFKISYTDGSVLCYYQTKNTDLHEDMHYLAILFSYNSQSKEYTVVNESGHDSKLSNVYGTTTFSNANCENYYFWLENNSSNGYQIVYDDDDIEYSGQVFQYKNINKTEEEEKSEILGDACTFSSEIEGGKQEFVIGSYSDNDTYFSASTSKNVGVTKTVKICPAISSDGSNFEVKTIKDFGFSCDKNKFKVIPNPDVNLQLNCDYLFVDKNLKVNVKSLEINEVGDLITTYVEYNNSNSQSIRLIKNHDGSYKAVYKSGESIDALSSDFIKNGIEGKNSYPKYLILSGQTYIFAEERQDNMDKIYINDTYLNKVGVGDEEIYQTCEELFGQNFLNFLNDYVFKIIWIGIPILLILLTSFDFAKVVFVDDKEGIQNAFRRFWKRAIVSVLIFLTPYIIILIANIIGAGDTVQDCAKEIRNMSQVSSIVKSNLTK